MIQKPIDSSFHQNNIKLLSQQVKNKHKKYADLLQYMIKEYTPQSQIINIGSMYQTPIQAQGVQLLTKYCYWNISMLNLTYHKIQNQGLQHIIKRNMPNNSQYPNQNYQKWNNIYEISVIKNNLTSQGFQGIQKINLQKLRVIRASNNKINHVAIYKFISCNWPNFVQLQFANNQIGRQGCKLLMRSNWPNFKRLDLNYNLIGNEGVQYLTQANWPQLTQLNLSNNRIESAGTFYIKNANWPNLKSLILNRNLIGKNKQNITNIGCHNLCQLKTSALQKLSLYGNQITLNGILLLLQSNKLVAGCFLQLSRNHFKFQDIREPLKTYNKFCNQFQN